MIKLIFSRNGYGNQKTTQSYYLLQDSDVRGVLLFTGSSTTIGKGEYILMCSDYNRKGGIAV